MTRLTGITYRRVLIETQQGNMGDVWAEEGDPRFVVQCKIGKRPPVWPALREANEAALKRTDERGVLTFAIAVLHRDGGPGRAAEQAIVMSPETFSWLIGSCGEGW